MRRAVTGVAALCTAVALGGCGATTTATPGSRTSTTTTSSLSTSIAAGDASTTSTSGASTPAVTLQIVSNGVVVTLAAPVVDLGDAIVGSALPTPTRFRATIKGVAADGTGPATQTSSSGTVVSVSATPSGHDVEISIVLRQPVHSFSTAIGHGMIVGFTFA